LVDQLAGLFWRLRRVPAIEAAIVKARDEEAYSDAYEEVKSATWDRIRTKANCRLGSLGEEQVKVAMWQGTYDEKLKSFEKEAIQEEMKKGDIDASISRRAEDLYQERRQSELLLLVRDEDGMIEKLSRYHASLMNAANRVMQQLRLIKIMRSSRTLIDF
jgi:hypothetical protein